MAKHYFQKPITYHLSYFVLEIIIEHFRCHYKYILNMLSCFCRCLKEEMNAFIFSEFLSFFLSNLPIFLSVSLISNQKHNNIRFTLCHYFLEPVIEIHKCFFPCNIVSKKDAMSTSVKNLCYRLKTLLSCSVPDL
jgi:hypothetical protein